MAQSNISPLIGTTSVDLFVPDTVQRHPLGFRKIEEDDIWGARELVYLKSAAALVYGNPCIVDVNFTATTMPTAIAQGKPIVVAATAFSAANQYGWFVVNGMAAVAGSSALAADAAVFAQAAGRIGATGVGKQLVGINVVQTSSRTIVKTATTQSGSGIIKVADASGWFVGMEMTGTGIGSSANITAIGTDNQTVTLTPVSTATGTVSVTGTFNDGTIHWLSCWLQAPASIV